MTIAKREWERQKDLGAQAARAGKKPHEAPIFGFTQDERDKEDAWWIGYQSVKPNAERPYR